MIDRASALVRAGAVVSYPRADEVVVVRVDGIPERRGPYEEARCLYTDLTANLGSRISDAMQTPAAC